MAVEYTEDNDLEGNPVIVRKSDGHTIPLDSDNGELCRLLNSSREQLGISGIRVPSVIRFFCCQMKDELFEQIRSRGRILMLARHRLNSTRHGNKLSIRHSVTPFGGCTFKQLRCAKATSEESSVNGLKEGNSRYFVSQPLLSQLNKELSDEQSTIRKLSTWMVQRAFVYLDVSDFSRFPAGQQALIISSLGSLTSDEQQWRRHNEHWVLETIKARFCIGDGYIFCFDNSVNATYFAARLARKIEEAVATKSLPVEFHFRAGVHVGPVYHFWDFGRNDWNFIGDGINGGSRVLEAIGKHSDDIVFVSDAVRNDILQRRPDWSEQTIENLIESLHNRGRKEDKHGNMWRVYELNHMNVK